MTTGWPAAPAAVIAVDRPAPPALHGTAMIMGPSAEAGDAVANAPTVTSPATRMRRPRMTASHPDSPASPAPRLSGRANRAMTTERAGRAAWTAHRRVAADPAR